MTRPFEGIRIIDITHVLAGPFAAYQLAVLGADVIKVEHPDDPDQSRGSGTDRALNRAQMGTGFLTQGSNKRAITLNLKTEQGREILKKLVGRFQRQTVFVAAAAASFDPWGEEKVSEFMRQLGVPQRREPGS